MEKNRKELREEFQVKFKEYVIAVRSKNEKEKARLADILLHLSEELKKED